MSDERWRDILESIPNWVDPYGAELVPGSQQRETDVIAEIRQRDPYLADQVETWISAGKTMRVRAAWLLSLLSKP